MKVPWGLVGILLIVVIVFGTVSYAIQNSTQDRQSHPCVIGQIITLRHILITVDANAFSDWTTITVIWPNGTTLEYRHNEKPFDEPQSGGWQYSTIDTWFLGSYATRHLHIETNSTLPLAIIDQGGTIGTLTLGQFDYAMDQYTFRVTLLGHSPLYGPFFKLANQNSVPVTVTFDLYIVGNLYMNPYEGHGCFA